MQSSQRIISTDNEHEYVNASRQRDWKTTQWTFLSRTLQYRSLSSSNQAPKSNSERRSDQIRKFCRSIKDTCAL
ncbi:hypothetical protein AC578_5608 [Pseudocercospora eumusae]|uniref:Uncharacterized protein n=1 Tax=Pseudocercospora eumusae TaxID=321146 RepID=A0A139HT70_9PEZI|nr:hypothetical protein AC578_5608 [Pseudocercospora eumusae]